VVQVPVVCEKERYDNKDMMEAKAVSQKLNHKKVGG